MEQIKIYKLTSLNLTELGGPMGMERVTENFQKYFSNIDSAKSFAQRDYNSKTDAKRKILWNKSSKNLSSSEDLGFVQYTIEKIVVDS